MPPLGLGGIDSMHRNSFKFIYKSLIIAQVLISQNVIPMLPADPEEVWKTGLDFLSTQPVAGPDDPIPCCDPAGNPATSEIRPM
jgi:hypothetical protein